MAPTAASVNDEKITVVHADGTIEVVKWDELDKFIVVTTDAGPFSTDVYFVLQGKENKSGYLIPQGEMGDTELLSAMQARLPGFDNKKFIEAMICTNNQSFEIWKRQPDEVNN